MLWPRRSIKSRGNKLVCFSFSMIMQALRYHPGESDFVLERNLSHPVIEDDDDVLVKVEFAGLCGTDLHIVGVRFFLIHALSCDSGVLSNYFQGEFGNCSIVPVTLGHEFSGIVLDSGKNVPVPPGTKGWLITYMYSSIFYFDCEFFSSFLSVAIDPNR